MGVAAAGYLSAGGLELSADPLGMAPGFQVFPVRLQLVKDFEGTLREIAAVGYGVVEMCSPPGFVTMDMAPLVKMKASEMRRIIGGVGLRCVSCHFQFAELKENLEDRIAWAKVLGLKHMIIATFALPQNATMDDWRRAADDANKMGAQTRKAGMQLGFHNHGFELRQIDGVLIFDELMRRFDKHLVKSQCQVANVVGAGLDPVEFLTKYPGRFVSLHLADRPAGGGRGQAAVGKGTIEWPKVFAAARIGGIEAYFVEMNMEALKDSYPYLHAMKV